MERLRARAAERDQLAGQVGALTAELGRLEAELAEAQSGRSAGLCPACRSELACPRCYRGND
jgi:hypothetical protein